MPLKYVHRYMGLNFSVLASIYYADGSVAISHGGIEMGQGIHTRVCNFNETKSYVDCSLRVTLVLVYVDIYPNIQTSDNSQTPNRT